MGDIIVCLILIVLMFFAIRAIIKKKSCGCKGCDKCGCGHCSTNEK